MVPRQRVIGGQSVGRSMGVPGQAPHRRQCRAREFVTCLAGSHYRYSSFTMAPSFFLTKMTHNETTVESVERAALCWLGRPIISCVRFHRVTHGTSVHHWYHSAWHGTARYDTGHSSFTVVYSFTHHGLCCCCCYCYWLGSFGWVGCSLMRHSWTATSK